MDENKNTITYDENWRQVSQPEIYLPREDEPIEESENVGITRKKHPKASRPLLLGVQLTLCLLIAAAAVIIKGIGGDTYSEISRLYRSSLNSAAIFDGRQSLDLSRLFTGATADELHR